MPITSDTSASQTQRVSTRWGVLGPASTVRRPDGPTDPVEVLAYTSCGDAVVPALTTARFVALGQMTRAIAGRDAAEAFRRPGRRSIRRLFAGGPAPR